ncbi:MULTISPECIES: pyridoxamine 5'-phosphate oxidase family protein [unclassified Rhizobium]|uniref:pyridoxamine 5'-phosphate oxidase family protein n=1 Tax=unclassified Rhizobium TaxID=2613769 RepID=UPI001ADD2B27|nr:MULTISPECIES: pyridoxamine 5'-phosphate oxidase family protein [unclassified Rhizobium]MBO9124053.1 pyridoxamine 5'-phosphate oxidase family protein [Rhizobium sp. 16-488-2b]MBO9174585.1 pyridoxamine 5'-phosphate oxidase family protein [Rhizobium sp. 16-488-2a]
MSTMTFEDLASKIRKIDFCMLSTQSGSGKISSRPMSNNGDVEYDGVSWFFSYEDTRKISEINGIDDVSLTFTEPPSLLGKPGIFIAIQGMASIVRDKEVFEAHWVSGLGRWFPDGTQTPGLVLIKVSASSVYYWDGEQNGQVDIPRG